jgi:hypothetical protein
MLDGSTCLKLRVLDAMEWTVIHVPYFSWHRVCQRGTQKEYLRTLLTRAEEAEQRHRAPAPAAEEGTAAMSNE